MIDYRVMRKSGDQQRRRGVSEAGAGGNDEKEREKVR